MSTRIAYNPATAFGQMAAEFVDGLLGAKETGRRLVAAMNSMTDNGTATWDQVETELGVAAGQGQAFYNIVVQASQKLNVAAFDDLTKIDQG